MNWMNFFATHGPSNATAKVAEPIKRIATTAQAQLPWIALRSAAVKPLKRQLTPFLIATNPINPVTKCSFGVKNGPEDAESTLEANPANTAPADTQRTRTPVLRVVCIGGTLGSIAANDVLTARLRISGRACDVRAELDRIAA